MVKKLLAVMFAATLMAGSAWAGDLTWQGANGNNWGDSNKWKDAEDADVTWTSTANDGDDAIFDGVTSQTVNIGAATTANSVTVQNSSDMIIGLGSGGNALTTTEGLKVTGDSKLTLTGSKESVFGTVIVEDDSTLAISDVKQIDSAALTLNNGTLETSAALTIANDIDLAAENVINAGGATELSGVISGDGKLVLSGAAFTLSGAANEYTGGTEINNTTVTFSNEDHFGTGDITFTGATTGLTAVTITGMDVANNMILSGDNDTTITTSVAELELSGAISGEKGLVLATGTSGNNITLSGTNTYAGGTTIQGGGSVSVASNANLGAADGDITIGLSGATLKLLDNITDMNRAIVMGANTLTIASGAYNLTNAGSVTGTGALTITGDADTETTVSLGDLSGHGTGGITVGSGDKVALEATKIGNENITLATENNKLIVNNSDAVTYNTATISGNGTFIKKGAGEFTLGTSSGLTAKNVEIQAGTFIVDGASTFGLSSTGNIAVFNGATLNVAAAGAALAAATMDLQSGSTLLLDGALAVNANTANFSSNSILKAGYAVTTGTNLITFTNITANATLDTEAYNATAFQNYLGKFATTGLVRDVAFAVATNNIQVTITDKSNDDAAAIIGGVMESQGVSDMTEYAKPLAGAWQDIAGTYMADPDDAIFTTETGKSTAALITKLADGGFKVTGDARGAEAAVNFLTGMDMAKSIDAAGQTAHRAVGNVFKRIQQNNAFRTAMNDTYGSADAYASSILNADYANRFWLAGMGMWETGDRYKGNAGYDYDAYGIQLGYDRVFGAMTFGGSFSYANGDYEDKAALANDSEIENYTFNLYGTYNHCSGFFASIVGGYTYSDYDMKSSYAAGLWNNSDYGADTWTIGTTLGYDIRPVQNFTITPSVGLFYYTSKSDTFNSTGLNGVQIKSHGTELPLALSMKYDVAVNECSTVSFEVNGGYTYRFSDESGKVTALGYNGINGVGSGSTTLKASRHSYNIGGGVTYSAARWDAGLKYDYYTSKASDAHVLRAEVGFKF